MMRKVYHSYFCTVAALAFSAGCSHENRLPASRPSSGPLQTASAAGDPATQPDMKKRPFLFDEASLPKGYPPPGPVGQVVVKQYPAARTAVNRGGDQDSMFMPLFNHIKKHDIAMSSPVEITWSDPLTQPAEAKPQAMAFVYREPNLGTLGADGPVEVIDVPAQSFLSIGVRGSYNREHLVEGVKHLRNWLAEHAGEFREVGPPRYLGYNSPFVPWFLRFGEVQVPIAAVEKK